MAGRNSARAQNRRGHDSNHSHSHQQAHTLCGARKVVMKKSISKTMEYSTIAAISAFAFLLYWNTLEADFAYDDSRAIKTNQDLLPTTPITNLFYNDFWGTPLMHSGSHKSYRPLCVLSFRLNYSIGALDPWSYHLFNVILHAVVTAIFTNFAGIIFEKDIVPTAAAGLLFAAHPIHTEAVAGVVGRADVGACLFFLLSMLSYMRYCKFRDKKFYLYGAMILSAASMLTKEHGITALIVCAMYDIFIYHKVTPRNIFTILYDKRYGSLREGLVHLTGAAVLLLALRFHLMGSKPPDFAPADNPASDNSSFWTRSLTFFYLPAFNFWLLLYPRWLSFDWSMEAIPLLTSFSDPRNFFSFLFYASTIYLILHVSRCLTKRATESSAFQCGCVSSYLNQRIGFKGHHYKNKNYSCFLNNNYSTSNGHHRSNGHHSSNGHGHHGRHSNHSYNSHYLNSSYTTNPPVPVDGVVIMTQTDVLVLAISLLIFPFIPATNLFFYVGFVVAERVLYIPSMGYCLLVAVGIDQIFSRCNTIFKKRVLISMFLLILFILSARTVDRNRDWWHEENLYRSGIPINPPKAYGNLANILSSQGKKLEAEIAYKKALSYRSNMADVHYNLGILLQEQARYDEALQSYRLAIQFRPRLAMAHLNLGLVLGILGRRDEAAEVYRHCAQLDSTGLKDPKMHETTKISALFNLGRLYADHGSYDEALVIYKEAVKKMPDHYQPQSLYNMMGEAYFKLKEYNHAEYWYNAALKVKPDHIPAHLTYAKLLWKWNRPDEAEQWFLKAKTVAPNDSSVYQHFGRFLSENERHAEAADMLMRAADLALDEYEIVFNAANALRQAGRNREAENYYQVAVKLRPNEVTSHMNLGAMLHVNGKLLEAETSYLRAMQLKPDDNITRNNLQKLRNLLVQKGYRTTASASEDVQSKR